MSEQATEQTQLTICAMCKYHRFENEIWHEQYCTHPVTEHKKVLNVVSGKMEYPSGHRYPHCNRINKGECPRYSRKKLLGMI